MKVQESGGQYRLKTDERLLEATLQALPVHIAVLDHDGTILFVNAAWQAFAHENGAPALAEMSVGLNYLAICDQAAGDGSEGAQEARQGIELVLAGSLPLFTVEYPCHSPDKERWFLLYAAPLAGGAGQAVVAHLDITDRKLLEKRVLATNQEMRDFLSLVSHEMRTPLASINGHVQLAQQRLQRLEAELLVESASGASLEDRLAAIQQNLERAETQIKHLNRLIADLAEVAHIQSGRLDIQPTRCDLAGIVREVVEEQKLIWPSRSIDLRLPEQAVDVMADRGRIGQVITNYMTNALKYAPADRPIEVSLKVEANQARVEVRDEGPGLRAEEQERIWQRFYRIPGAEVQKGVGISLGMGLYICRSIITQHGGQTGVESTPGAGATFWFTLPLDGASEAATGQRYATC